jgi:hypothetical protein
LVSPRSPRGLLSLLRRQPLLRPKHQRHPCQCDQHQHHECQRDQRHLRQSVGCRCGYCCTARHFCFCAASRGRGGGGSRECGGLGALECRPRGGAADLSERLVPTDRGLGSEHSASPGGGHGATCGRQADASPAPSSLRSLRPHRPRSDEFADQACDSATRDICSCLAARSCYAPAPPARGPRGLLRSRRSEVRPCPRSNLTTDRRFVPAHGGHERRSGELDRPAPRERSAEPRAFPRSVAAIDRNILPAYRGHGPRGDCGPPAHRGRGSRQRNSSSELRSFRWARRIQCFSPTASCCGRLTAASEGRGFGGIESPARELRGCWQRIRRFSPTASCYGRLPTAFEIRGLQQLWSSAFFRGPRSGRARGAPSHSGTACTANAHAPSSRLRVGMSRPSSRRGCRWGPPFVSAPWLLCPWAA